MVYCIVTLSTLPSAQLHFMASSNSKQKKTILPNDILQSNKSINKMALIRKGFKIYFH